MILVNSIFQYGDVVVCGYRDHVSKHILLNCYRQMTSMTASVEVARERYGEETDIELFNKNQ